MQTIDVVLIKYGSSVCRHVIGLQFRKAIEFIRSLVRPSQIWQRAEDNSVHLLSGLDLLCPAALYPFLSDLGFLPGFPHKLLACTRNNYIRSATILGIALDALFFLAISTKQEKLCQTEGCITILNILKQTANNHKSLFHLQSVHQHICFSTQIVKYKMANFRWSLWRLMIAADKCVYQLTCEVLWWRSLWAASPWTALLAFSHPCMDHRWGPGRGKVRHKKKNVSKLYACWLSIFESPAENLPYFGRWHPRWPPACQHGVRKRRRRHGRSQRNVWTPRQDKIRGYRMQTRLLVS